METRPFTSQKVFPVGFAPAFNRSRITALHFPTGPDSAACRAVPNIPACALTFAPLLHSDFTTAVWPWCAAACNALPPNTPPPPPPLSYCASTSTPAFINCFTTFAWPPITAACNVVPYVSLWVLGPALYSRSNFNYSPSAGGRRCLQRVAVSSALDIDVRVMFQQIFRHLFISLCGCCV